MIIQLFRRKSWSLFVNKMFKDRFFNVQMMFHCGWWNMRACTQMTMALFKGNGNLDKQGSDQW